MILQDLIDYLDRFLAVDSIADYPGALNGLQVENRGRVTRVAAAVDATEASIRRALDSDCDLLLVHHGLFWNGNRPVRGRRYRRLRLAIEGDLAVYSAHLPLDMHETVGNNAVLARELAVVPDGRFGEFEGQPLGVTGELESPRQALAAKLEELLGTRVTTIPGGPERIRRVGILTGGGGGMIEAALAAGLDALVTGEGSHHTYFDAMEGFETPARFRGTVDESEVKPGLNVYYAGHYATETVGVRALAAHLEAEFALPWQFLDLPTGL